MPGARPRPRGTGEADPWRHHERAHGPFGEHPSAGPAGDSPDTAPARSPSPAAAGRLNPVVPAILATLLLVALLAVVAVTQLVGGADPTRGLPAWDQLDTRWGTYLSEREWGTPREAVGGNGWGLDYLDAIKTQYRYGEDGIAGLTTRDGAFAIGWAAWDGRQVRVAERYFGWSNPSGEHGEAIVDRRTFGANTPTSSYYRTVFEYPAKEPTFEITFDGARADSVSGVVRATAIEHRRGRGPARPGAEGLVPRPDTARGADPQRAAPPRAVLGRRDRGAQPPPAPR